MAVGMVSLVLCPMLTWSLGCTGVVGAFLPAKRDVGEVGDDLVGVHVVRGAGTGLEAVHDKLGVVFAGNDGIGGLEDGVRQLRIEPASPRFATAAARLIHTWATVKSRSGPRPEIGKLPTARAVWTPYQASAGDWKFTQGIFSVRNFCPSGAPRGMEGIIGSVRPECIRPYCLRYSTEEVT